MSSKKDGRVGVSMDFAADTHWYLKVYCAEERLTLKKGIERIVENRLESVKMRMGSPPWARHVNVPTPKPGQEVRVTAVGAGWQQPTEEPEAALQRAAAQGIQDALEDAVKNGHVDLAGLAQDLQEKQSFALQVRLTAEPGSGLRHRETGILTSGVDEEGQADPGYDPDVSYERYRAQGHSREVAIERVEAELEDSGLDWQAPDAQMEIATRGPITSFEYDVPNNWIDSAGVTRAQNVKRFGEDEKIEYFPPIKAPGMDIEAPVDVTALKGIA
jgi:hypothetical protein